MTSPGRPVRERCPSRPPRILADAALDLGWFLVVVR
jgi:hypothetical protein